MDLIEKINFGIRAHGEGASQPMTFGKAADFASVFGFDHVDIEGFEGFDRNR